VTLQSGNGDDVEQVMNKLQQVLKNKNSISCFLQYEEDVKIKF